MFILEHTDESKKYYFQPVMVLSVKSVNDSQNSPDDEILKMFSGNPATKAIVIAGPEPMDELFVLRDFIFSARKFLFSDGIRPLIIVYTDYFVDELFLRNWEGLRCEFMYYGNIMLKYGRKFHGHNFKIFNPLLGVKVFADLERVHHFNKFQHE